MKKIQKNSKNGSVVAICLVFATVLLVMGLGYSRMTSTAKTQTVQIDDRIKLEYLANGITEIALLKYQLYPADFYACLEAANKHNNKQYLLDFTENAQEFKFNNDKYSQSSYNKDAITLWLASMTILTDQKWKTEILYINADAKIQKSDNTELKKDVTRVVEIERKTKSL